MGSLLGPPIASAAASLVTIEGAGSTNKANVFSFGGLETFSFTAPNGEAVLASGSFGHTSKSGTGVITGINFNVEKAAAPLTVDLRKGTGVSNSIIWEATVAAPGSASFPFENGEFISTGGFAVTVRGATTGDKFHYEVYGTGFGVKAALPGGLVSQIHG